MVWRGAGGGCSGGMDMACLWGIEDELIVYNIFFR